MCACLVLLATDAQAAAEEQQIRNLILSPAELGKPIRVESKRGYATLVEFDKKETVQNFKGQEAAAAGDMDGWEVQTSPGQNLLFLKPKMAAQNTNLILITNRHSYVFDLRVLDDKSPKKGIWRLMIEQGKGGPSPATIQEATAPQKRNTQYSMQAASGQEDFIPTEAWDDGVFTYLTLPSGGDVPAIFKVTEGEESAVNFRMDGETVVIHETGRQFVMRIGKQVVSIWNEGYGKRNQLPKPEANRILISSGAAQ